jgi:hypothetical protein
MHIPPAARSAILASILAVLGGALLIALMFADGLGIGPRHQEWRDRMRNRWTRRQSW